MGAWEDWEQEFRQPGLGRIMVDVFGITFHNTVVCVLPVFLQKDNFQNSLLSFVSLYNSTLSTNAKKYRLRDILRVRPHSNYFPPPLQEMLIYNELDRLVEEFKLSPRYTSITVWNLNYEVLEWKK